MQKMILRLAPAALFFGAVVLATGPGTRAQGDAVAVFKKHCAMCHAEDGSGNSTSGKALKLKDLRSAEVQKQTDAELTDVITKGRGKMPAFAAKLSPETIKSLVAYVRQIAKK